MNAFVLGLFIMLLGMVFGLLVMYLYMDGKVEWWREKYEMEHRLKEKLMERGADLLNTELRIFNDIRSAIQTKGKGL
jgi:hypothetical protein